jgi:hypothetical protein
MTITIPNEKVAIRNSSAINWALEYGGQTWRYPAGEVTLVPFEVAHKHFGFEVDEEGKVFRNTADEYSDGEETQYRSSLASILPECWKTNALANVPIDEGEWAGKTHKEAYKLLRASYETGISAKLVKAPKKISTQQWDQLG